MSLKDELERARKEKNNAEAVHAARQKQTREILTKKLEQVFSNLSSQMRVRNKWYLDKLVSLNACDTLSELGRECNLAYVKTMTYTEQKDRKGKIQYTQTEKVTPPQIDFFLRSIPESDQWYAEHQKRVSQVVSELFPTSVLQHMQYYTVFECRNQFLGDISDLYDSMINYSEWLAYQRWKDPLSAWWKFGTQYETTISDFEILSKAFEIPPLSEIEARLTWDFSTYQDEMNYSEYYKRMIISVSTQAVTVKREGLERDQVSIPIQDCTAAWVKQQVAKMYVKFETM